MVYGNEDIRGYSEGKIMQVIKKSIWPILAIALMNSIAVASYDMKPRAQPVLNHAIDAPAVLESPKTQTKASKKVISPKVNSEKIAKQLLEKSTAQALEGLQQGNLTELDPLVGEWMCQGRAIEVIRLRQAVQDGTPLTTENKEFLGLCRMLTQTKKREKMTTRISLPTEVTDHKRLNTQLSRSFAEVFIRKCQTKLAGFTVNAIQRAAKELGDPELSKAVSITKIDSLQFNRLHCAFFPATKAVLDGALHYKIPLLVKVKRYTNNTDQVCYFFYKPTSNGYQATNIEDYDVSSAIMIVEGVSAAQSKARSEAPLTPQDQLNNFSQLPIEEFEKQFPLLDIRQIILICAADHQQFVGKQHEGTPIPFEENGLGSLKSEMESLQKKASHFKRDVNGGPYVFCVDHIYASTLKEHLHRKILILLQDISNASPSICDLVLAYI